jgi:DNA topoisomerase-3
MIVEITNNVKFAKAKKIAVVSDTTKEKKIRAPKKEIKIEELTCPKCKSGQFLKGKKAYGCSNFKNGCKVLIPFVFMGKKLTPKQLSDLISKGKTSKIKGFIDIDTSEKKDGTLTFDNDYKVILT